jgi:methyltransferase (TIGR00027 family)
MFKNLKMTVYQVPDMSRAKNWYSNFLGIDPISDTPFSVVFLIGEIWLALALNENPVKEDNEQVSVFWEVDDVDETLRRMIDLGASLHTEPMNRLMMRTAKARDPFGNVIGLVGSIPRDKNNLVENQPSETAMGVSLYRAMAAQDERNEVRGPDVYARLFLSEELKKVLVDPSSRAKASPELYGYFIARTAFMDHLFEEAVRDQTPQIVILGAGYDTRAYRFRDRLGATRVYELDAPATQNRKIDILQKESIPIPPQVSFVPINFEKDELGNVLDKTAFNRNLASLFVVEGVLYYLTAAAVDKLLNAIKRYSIPGGKLCFDYVTQKLPSARSGEPLQFWNAEERIESYLAVRGFNVLDQVDSKEMEKRYLMLRDGTPAEKPYRQFQFILAERLIGM